MKWLYHLSWIVFVVLIPTGVTLTIVLRSPIPAIAAGGLMGLLMTVAIFWFLISFSLNALKAQGPPRTRDKLLVFVIYGYFFLTLLMIPTGAIIDGLGGTSLYLWFGFGGFAGGIIALITLRHRHPA